MGKIERRLGLKYSAVILLMFALTVAVVLTALSIGSVQIDFSEILRALSGGDIGSRAAAIIFEIRLPRIILAVSVGGGLSVAGAVFQAMLMNPLAEPYILGISSGGAFGALLAILLGFSFLFIQLFSFTGAIIVMLVVFVLGRRFGEIEPNVLLLSGVMMGALFSAAILLLIVFMNDSLRTAVFWMIGNLSIADKTSSYYIFPVSLIISFIFSINAYKLNVLSLGSKSAKQLGVNIKLLKNGVYILAGLLVGALVSVSGIIGFVGLLVPHICRLFWGYDNRLLIPVSFFAGAIYLTIADTIARTIISPAELPVGAITAIIGAPVFIYLLRRRMNYF